MTHAPWFHTATPGEPASGLLRRAFGARVEWAAQLAVFAARHSAENSEYVHQLRVATRRAAAVLDACDAPFLGSARRQRLRRGLRRLRALASTARDLDVALEHLIVLPPDSLALAARVPLVHATAMERGEAQICLQAGIRKLRRKHRFRKWRGAASRIAWRSEEREPTTLEWARVRLTSLADDLESAALPWPVTVDTLHRLRIIAKQCRYEVELFAGVLPDPWRECLDQFKQFQDDLGTWHDLRVRLALWNSWLELPLGKKMPLDVARLIATWSDEEPRRREQLGERWTSGPLEQLLGQLRILTSGAGSPETT